MLCTECSVAILSKSLWPQCQLKQAYLEIDYSVMKQYDCLNIFAMKKVLRNRKKHGLYSEKVC